MKNHSQAAGDRGAVQTISRFLIVGSLCTMLQYGILIALVQLSGAHPALASSVGFAVSACLNYLLNYAFTFGSDSPHPVAASRFAASAVAGLALTYVLMRFLVEVASFNYVMGQLVTTGLVLAFNFVLLSRWAYVAPHRGESI